MTLPGIKKIAPEHLMSIPVGAIILVGARLDGAEDREESSVWFVFSEGKAEILNSRFPHSETEDLDWFKPWEVSIIGVNEEYAINHYYQSNNMVPVRKEDLLSAGWGVEVAPAPVAPRPRRRTGRGSF